MINREYNNDFFGWEGTISRKNYTINLFIVCMMCIVLSFVNFQAFEPFIPFKFLLTIIVFMADLIRLVLVMCALSLVYRRIIDFSVTKTYQFQLNMKRLFVFLFVVPVLYILCIRSFLSFMPVFINILDILIGFIVIPLSIICSIVFCFIKAF